ncbi:aldo/keto reductase [Microbacterium neimengense]
MTVELGSIGYGVAALGNLFTALAEDVWPACVPAAWDAGVRYFDVAPHYGLGLAEERLGASLAAYPRDEYVISTKVGRVLEPDPDGAARTDIANLFDVPATRRRVLDYSRDGVLRSFEQSLERLGLDRIDILLVHDPDAHEREALEGAFPALAELKSQGVIRAYGAGMNQSGMLTRFVEETDLDLVMCAGRYTLLQDAAAHDLLPAARRRGVEVVAAGVFNSGILATARPRSDAHFDYGGVPDEVRRRVERIADLADGWGVTIPELAVQFPLRHPAITTVVLGAASPEQVRANSRLTARPVPEEVWGELAAHGLLPASAVSA